MNLKKAIDLNLIVRVFTVLSFATFFVACENYTNKKSDLILEKEEFIPIVMDFQKADAIIRLGYNRTTDSLILNDSVYNSVFRKHGITREIFDTNFTYYSKNSEEFELMYEQIIENFNDAAAERTAKKNKAEKEED